MDKDEDGRRHREAQEEIINRRMAEQMNRWKRHVNPIKWPALCWENRKPGWLARRMAHRKVPAYRVASLLMG